MKAYKFIQPVVFTGSYPSNWAGYSFKETLGYTTGRHTGVDYNWGYGDQDLNQPIRAIANGTVCYVGDQTGKGFGKTIILKHDLDSRLATKYNTPSLYSRYMHLNNWVAGIKIGSQFNVGQQIGTLGKTGTIYAHLHLDLWKANLGCHLEYHKDTALTSYLDPFSFIETNKNNVEVSVAKPTAQEVVSAVYASGASMTALGRTRDFYTSRDVSVLRKEARAWRDKTHKQVVAERNQQATLYKNCSEAKDELQTQIASLNKTISDLSERPTKAEMQSALDKVQIDLNSVNELLNASNEKIAELEKKNQEAESTQSGIAGVIARFFDKIFNRKGNASE